MKKIIILLSFLAVFVVTGYTQTARVEIDYDNSVGLWMNSDTILTCTDVEIAVKYTCDYTCNLATGCGFVIYSDDGGNWWNLEGDTVSSDYFFNGFDAVFISHELGDNDGPPADTIGMAAVAIFGTGWVTPDTAQPFKIKFHSGFAEGSHIKIDLVNFASYYNTWYAFDLPCADHVYPELVPEWSGPYEFTLHHLPCLYDRGDVNCSGGDPDITDITALIDHLYLSRDHICCIIEADTNDSGGDPDISDITKLIDHLYLSKTPLPVMPSCK